MTAENNAPLEITRVIDAPRSVVWRCWTEPELFKQWFVPKPWGVAAADFDLRPGGRNNVTMRSPEGQEFPNTGCFLEVVDGEALTFTDAFAEGFQPQAESFMTGYMRLSDAPDGKTHMIWGARHGKAEDRQKHIDMGFETGWNASVDQLEALAKSLKGDAAAPRT